jgi:hypothetical protein
VGRWFDTFFKVQITSTASGLEHARPIVYWISRRLGWVSKPCPFELLAFILGVFIIEVSWLEALIIAVTSEISFSVAVSIAVVPSLVVSVVAVAVAIIVAE